MPFILIYHPKNNEYSIGEVDKLDLYKDQGWEPYLEGKTNFQGEKDELYEKLQEVLEKQKQKKESK